jgi:hypothetical protein
MQAQAVPYPLLWQLRPGRPRLQDCSPPSKGRPNLCPSLQRKDHRGPDRAQPEQGGERKGREAHGRLCR